MSEENTPANAPLISDMVTGYYFTVECPHCQQPINILITDSRDGRQVHIVGREEGEEDEEDDYL